MAKNTNTPKTAAEKQAAAEKQDKNPVNNLPTFSVDSSLIATGKRTAKTVPVFDLELAKEHFIQSPDDAIIKVKSSDFADTIEAWTFDWFVVSFEFTLAQNYAKSGKLYRYKNTRRAKPTTIKGTFLARFKDNAYGEYDKLQVIAVTISETGKVKTKLSENVSRAYAMLSSKDRKLAIFNAVMDENSGSFEKIKAAKQTFGIDDDLSDLINELNAKKQAEASDDQPQDDVK